MPLPSDFSHSQAMPPTFLRDTVKKRAPGGASTYLEESLRYGASTTSHSRPTHLRHPRQPMSHSHSRTHPPPKHLNHCSRCTQPSDFSNKPLPETQPSPPDFNQEFFVGHLTKDQFVQRTSDALDKQAYRNDGVALPTYSEPESVFFSVSKPDIPTPDYVKRLVTYTQCSPAAFVLMLIYLDRIAEANRRLHVTPFNMHRLLVTALTLACKVLDDRCFSNVHYAKVGGIPTAREMNRLELQFLSYLKYYLHVTPEQYQEKLGSLQNLISPPPPQEYVPQISPVTASSSLDGEDFGSMTSSLTSSSTSSTVSFSKAHDTTRTRPEPNHLIHSQSFPRSGHHTAPVEKISSWNSGYIQRVDKRSRYNGRRHRADFAGHRMATDL